LYNFDSARAVADASLRDQCYRRKFYGPSDDIEDALATLESKAAPVFQSIRANRTLPALLTEEYETLLAFVALQVLRTSVVANRVDARVDKMMKQVHADDPRIAKEDLEAMHFGYADPVLASLRSLPAMLDAISDLHGHLLLSTTGDFITSDNPAFKYNQYCEEVQHMGTTGALCSGLQIFMPMTPELQLLLYDPVTYKVKRSERYSRRSIATQSDIDQMNSIQLISAGENVYSSDWRLLEHIGRLVPIATARRIADPTVVQEYGQDGNPNSSLLHTFERTPCLKLELSFLSIRWRVRSVPLADRPRRYRKALPMPPMPEPPHPKDRTVTFSRFIGRR